MEVFDKFVVMSKVIFNSAYSFRITNMNEYVHTFNIISVISWRSVLLVDKTGVPWKNRRPAASHWQTLSHKDVSSKPCLIGVRTHNLVVICTDCIGSCNSNYHMTTAAPRTWMYSRNTLYYILETRQSALDPNDEWKAILLVVEWIVS